jgi:PKHD-type hydroxylase
MSYNYKGIMNNPYERSRIIYPYCWWDGTFTNEELNNICELLAKDGVQRATTVGQNPEDTANLEIEISKPEAPRKSMVKFHNYNENTGWIFEKLNFTIDQVNSRFYNFDLNGYDGIQYTEYYDYEGGKYDFHMDTIMDTTIDFKDVEVRKLSMTLVLNEPGVDFEGGAFEINNGRESEALKVDAPRGRIILFPSFMIHRVAPVTKGTRKSLVVWVLGPKFK